MRNEEKAIQEMYRESGIRDDLFIVHKAAKAAGLSRTSIVKLEKEGFIQPKKVNKKTGYRYFDTFNIYKLVQYRTLRLMGMTQQEIYDYFTDDEDRSAEILEQMRMRLKLLQRGYEEFALRTSKEKHDTFSFIDIDGMTCLTEERDFASPKEVETVAFNLSVEAIDRGFCPLATEMIFTERSDTQSDPSDNPADSFRAKICIPIEPELPVDADRSGVEVFPACRAFSVLHYGGYEDPHAFDESRKRLWEEMEARGLKPIGPMRNIGVVAPYVGMHIEAKDYVFRFAVPVEG